MQTLIKNATQHSNNHKMINKADIQAVISNLELQEALNFTLAARKYNVKRATLMHCFKGKTVSTAKSYSECLKPLTDS